MIFSAQFWPQLKDDDLEWPLPVRHCFDEYRKKFESLKASRSIDWKPNLGLVKLELEFKQRTIEFNVSPLLASIIWQFQIKGEKISEKKGNGLKTLSIADSWTTEELAAVLRAAPSAIKRRMSWWSGCGVLRQSDQPSAATWKLADDLPLRHSGAAPIVADDDDDADAAAVDNDREKHLEVINLLIVETFSVIVSFVRKTCQNDLLVA